MGIGSMLYVMGFVMGVFAAVFNLWALIHTLKIGG